MQQDKNALKVPATRNNSLYQSGPVQKMRGSTMDIRGSQRHLIGLQKSAQGSSMALENRIVK